MDINSMDLIELTDARFFCKEVTAPLGIRHLVLVCWYGDRVSVGW
ncbi:MAG: hypothetical protein P1P72_05585 [ANME-2 cluster archaeon]|nr:hypothetical protein [ANME-2 cluster archaeon]